MDEDELEEKLEEFSLWFEFTGLRFLGVLLAIVWVVSILLSIDLGWFGFAAFILLFSSLLLLAWAWGLFDEDSEEDYDLFRLLLLISLGIIGSMIIFGVL